MSPPPFRVCRLSLLSRFTCTRPGARPTWHLSDAGLPAPGNRRATPVELTSAGRSHVEEWQAFQLQLADEVAAPLTPDQRRERGIRAEVLGNYQALHCTSQRAQLSGWRTWLGWSPRRHRAAGRIPADTQNISYEDRAQRCAYELMGHGWRSHHLQRLPCRAGRRVGDNAWCISTQLRIGNSRVFGRAVTRACSALAGSRADVVRLQ